MSNNTQCKFNNFNRLFHQNASGGSWKSRSLVREYLLGALMPLKGRKCARVISGGFRSLWSRYPWPIAGEGICPPCGRTHPLPLASGICLHFRAATSRPPRRRALAKGRRQLMALQAILAVPVSNPYESRLSTGRKRKQPVAFATSCLSLLRKKGDSNPRYPVKGIPVFETSAFSHSAILPLGTAKICKKKEYKKRCSGRLFVDVVFLELDEPAIAGYVSHWEVLAVTDDYPDGRGRGNGLLVVGPEGGGVDGRQVGQDLCVRI